MSEFVMPEFLLNRSTEENHEKMKSVMPADIDMSAGNHAWNLTYPTALIAAEICEFILPAVIQLIFPEWSYGEFLDEHAKSIGMTRRAAAHATGKITITGKPGTVIPLWSMFSTAAVNDRPSVDYATQEAVTIPESGTLTVGIECTQGGTVGNTGKGTIVLVASNLKGITAVINEEAVTGGTEEEDDESLKERIAEYNRSQGDSYVGSVADYKRWAMSVPGVGSATVIPAQDTSGLVTIIVTDANGAPATEQLCTSVYNHIMKPDDPMNRLTSPNANLNVVPPTTMEIGVTATVELAENATLESVKKAYTALLAVYLAEAMDDKEIKYSRVCAVLSATEGVSDHSNLQIGLKTGDTISYGTANIPITSQQLPTVSSENLILTAGTV